jgi:hypothetical protein
MAIVATKEKDRAVSPYVLVLRQALIDGAGKRLGSFATGTLVIEIRSFANSVWALIRRPGRGGLALRAAYLAGDFDCAALKSEPGEVGRFKVTSPLGTHILSFQAGGEDIEYLRLTVRFTPEVAMVMPFMPRDLYPLDAHDDPLGAEGQVEATQRGLNSGLVYFRIDQPGFGNVLYFQNLTAMNGYYEATGTKPDGAVGGEWPELGWLLPTPPQSSTPPTKPLAAGVEVALSDAILVFRSDAGSGESDSARQFLQLLGSAYKLLDLQRAEYRDWLDRSERTLRDLDKAPEATIRHYGHRYVHPYTAAEYPDIMVQMTLVAAIHDWGKWQGTPHPLEAELKAGLGKFYDSNLRTFRRYLPNVGKEKDKDAVDSWYLYHPMVNLGILALDGDAEAKALLLRSIDYGIKAAQHFKYEWPIQYNITDFSVIKESAGSDGRGQTDVGGVYAWVMLQAFELTDDKKYLDEARNAIGAAIGLRFNINYQANLTAWGAAACMRLWRLTTEERYLAQSYVYLGSFFHNCEIWESEIALAKHYRNFLGATCLQDAPYMAIYECFDSFAAFERYLDDSGPDLEPAARMLIAEYCKYALDRAWYYYPDALPPEAISPKQRESNGHVDRALSFPLEDLYPDGQQAGQVGQEIYGAGAAMVFATRAFHKVEGASFLLSCDHFVRAMERTGDRALSITLDGGETCAARISLVRRKRHKLGRIRVSTIGGDNLRPVERSADRVDFIVPANGRVIVGWSEAGETG